MKLAALLASAWAASAKAWERQSGVDAGLPTPSSLDEDARLSADDRAIKFHPNKEVFMLRKGIAIAALSVCGLATIAGTASTAKAVDNPFELTLSGSGDNGNKFNGFEASGNVGIGYYLTENFELAVRQSVGYSDLVPGTTLDASTVAAIDFNIPLGDHGQFVPFFGADIGYVYGHDILDTWEAAPEAGIKFYVNSTTFIYGEAEYQFFFRHASGAGLGNGFNNGQFVYTLGIGLRL